MKNNKLTFAFLTVAAVAMYFSIIISYKKGWWDGANFGYSSALDTVTKVCIKQSKSDTSITKLHIINPDTFYVYLQRKTPLKPTEHDTTGN